MKTWKHDVKRGDLTSCFHVLDVVYFETWCVLETYPNFFTSCLMFASRVPPPICKRQKTKRKWCGQIIGRLAQPLISEVDLWTSSILDQLKCRLKLRGCQHCSYGIRDVWYFNGGLQLSWKSNFLESVDVLLMHLTILSQETGNLFSTRIDEVVIPAVEWLGALKYFFHRVVFGYICTTIRGDIVDRPTRLAIRVYYKAKYRQEVLNY